MSSSGRSLVCMRDVSKVFDTGEVETHALSGVDLDIHEGEYVAIAGPSGCGKSTLLSLLGLLDTVSDGQYLFDGQDTRGFSSAERARIRCQRIGFVFEDFSLISDLTVFDNVALPLVYQRLSAPFIRERVRCALERVGMSARMKQYPSQLSGGQQQRVAVARAIAGEPAILLVDEPTGNLDSANGILIMDFLKQLHFDGVTICMVTHEPRYMGYADRLVSLFDGRVIADGHAVAVNRC